AEAFPISGQRCVEVGGRWAVAAITPDERSRRPGDIISGPTIFGLCDAVLWYALFGAVGLEPMALTSELSIRYLRPARGDTVFARAELHHVGKRSVIGSIRCWVDEAEDKTVAVAQGTYIRPQPRS
ncbi:MAG: PaaI family thioesterase, partial [Pseudomonadota bacterium]|nr:PaaI family thioesterase [Pseudomonadota bacterium]